MKLGEAKFGENFMAMFVGKPGDGKSVAAASWYKEGRIRIYDLDRRYRSLLKMYGWDPVARENIDIESYESDQFEEVERSLNKLEGNNPFRTIVFDGLTNLANQLINYSIKLRGVAGSGREGKGRSLGVIDMTSIEDFGLEARGLRGVLDALADLYINKNINVIMTAHLIQWNEKVGAVNGVGGHEEPRYQLITAGKKIAGSIGGDFDEMYYFRRWTPDPSVPPKFECFTQGSEAFPGKTALHLPTKIDWTMTKRDAPTFYEIIQGHVKSSREKGF